MKRFLYLFISAAVMACATSCSEKLTAEQKYEREQQQAIAAAAARQRVADMDFIMPIEVLQLSKGRTFHPAGNETNFMMVHDGKFILQATSASNPRPGYNGMGGLTVSGNVRLVSHNTDKKGNDYYEYAVSGATINARVNISIPKGSARASAYVTGNFSGRSNIRIQGPVEPYVENSLIIGRHL